jgi:hypothetical protein
MTKVASGLNGFLSQIDTNRNGVTKAEIKKADKDGNGQLSAREAPQLNPRELTQMNQYLSNAQPANQMIFPLKASAAPEAAAQRPAGRTRGAAQPAAAQPATAAQNGPGSVKGLARGTGYYPANNKMEGGFNDKLGKPLHTLQDVLDGKAPYVSIALDKKLYKNGTIKYGDTFRIPELEAKYGRKIVFRAVDTGGAFTNKGFSRVDVCTRSRQHSLEPTVNGKLTLIKTS